MLQIAILRSAACAGLVAILAVAWAAGAHANCYAFGQQRPTAEVSEFLSNPNAWLNNPTYKSGGGALISAIRDLAASDPAALAAIIGLLATANAEQQTAIGAGLGQAAAVCVKTDQPYATAIQQAIAATNNANAQTAFRAVLADAPIGGVGGGAGGGGPGGGGESPTSPPGGVGTLAPSIYSPWGPFGTKTIGFASSFLSGSVGGPSSGPTSNGGVTSSVSPHR